MLQRLKVQHESLATLALAESRHVANLQESLRSISRTASECLRIQRASIWYCIKNNTGLTCQCQYDAGTGEYTSGVSIDQEQYPAYFQALVQAPIIDAHDALTDSRTACLAESYLQPLQIKSMLDVPIYIDGLLFGVLCLEHTQTARNWLPEEMTYAMALAALVALASERHKRVQAETAACQKEERFRALIENAFEGILLVNQAGQLLYASSKGTSTLGRFGHAIPDLLGTTLFGMVHEQDRPALMQAFAGMAQQPGSEVAHQARILRADGQWRYLDMVARNALDQPAIAGIIINYRDITEVWNAQRAVQQSEKRLREALEVASLASYQWNYQRDQGYWCNEMFRIHGIPSHYPTTRHHFFQLIHPDDRRLVEVTAIRTMSRQEPYALEYRIVRPDGQIRWLLSRGNCLTNDEGRVVGFQGICQDITARKISTERMQLLNEELEARVNTRTAELQHINVLLKQQITEQRKIEATLVASEERYRAVAKHIADGLLMTDLDDIILDVNDQFLLLTGYMRHEVIGRCGYDLFTYAEDKEGIRQHNLDRATGLSANYTIRFLRKDRTFFWAELTSAPLRSPEEDIIGTISLVKDVSQRKELEAALQASDARYRAFIANSTEGIWRFEIEPPINTDLRIAEQAEQFLTRARLAECNQAMARMYGYDSPSEMLGKPFRDFHHDSDRHVYERVCQFIENEYSITDSLTVETSKEGYVKHYLNNATGTIEDGQWCSVWGTQREFSDLKRMDRLNGDTHPLPRTRILQPLTQV